MAKKHGLGRGLDALLAPEPQEGAAKEEQAGSIPIGLIDLNPNQPRKSFDPEKTRELAESIAVHGILQPLLLVRRDERYMIVAGERRYRAARMANLKEVPAIIREFDDRQIAEVALVENLQRDDLNPIEEAMGIRALIDTFHLTQEQVGARLGMSRPAVTNALRLLNLPDAVQRSLQEGRISAGHGRAIAGVGDPHYALLLTRRIEEQGLTVRQTEEAAAMYAGEIRRKAKKAPIPPDAALSELTQGLMEALGTKVEIQGTQKRGKIIISYFDMEDLQRIYDIAMSLCGQKNGR